MCIWRLQLLALTAAVAVTCVAGSHHNTENELGITTLEEGTHIQWEEFPGHKGLAALKYMFTTAQVVVNCPGHQDFAVYVGRTMPDVRTAYEHQDRAWCGWERFSGLNKETCKTPVNPGGTTYVAVIKPKTWFSADNTAGGSGGKTACTMELVEAFSMPRAMAAAIGTFLFWGAPALSESTPFRLTGGALGFMATSILVVTFILWRSVPHKRTMAVGSAIFGSTIAAAARYAFGTWLPTMRQLIENPLILAYLLLSGLAGLAVTYYYNDTTNYKLNTILKVALQLVGLMTLALSPSMPEGTLTLLTAVIGGKSLHAALKHKQGIQGVQAAAQQAVVEFKDSLSPGGYSSYPSGAGAGADYPAGPGPPPSETLLARISSAPARGAGPSSSPSLRPYPVAVHRTTDEDGSHREGRSSWLQALRLSPPARGGTTPPTPAAAAAGGHPHVDVAQIPSWLAQVSPLTTTPLQQQYQAPAVSPLIEKGLVLNEETGKTIQIGKATYKKLLKEGYVVDNVAGTIAPSPLGGVTTTTTAAAGSGGSGGVRSGGRSTEKKKGSGRQRSSSKGKSSRGGGSGARRRSSSAQGRR